MSYEKVKITGIREVVKRDTGAIHKFLQVEVMQKFDIYLNDNNVKNQPLYEQLKNNEVLLPVSWSEYNGRPSLNISDDGVPLQVPTASTQPAASPVQTAANEAPVTTKVNFGAKVA